MLNHIAFGIDDDGRSDRTLDFLAIHHLFAEGVVFLHDVGFGV